MLHLIEAGDAYGNEMRVHLILEGPERLPEAFCDFEDRIQTQLNFGKVAWGDYRRSLKELYLTYWPGGIQEEFLMTWIWVKHLVTNHGYTIINEYKEHFTED